MLLLRTQKDRDIFITYMQSVYNSSIKLFVSRWLACRVNWLGNRIGQAQYNFYHWQANITTYVYSNTTENLELFPTKHIYIANIKES